VRIADDAGGGDLEARAHVARAVTPATATARGLTAGVGLELDGFAPFDEARYDALIQRIAHRAGLRLLVGAAAARGAPLIETLASAGYVVTGQAEPAELEAQVARVRPDLVVMDPRFRARLPREVQVLAVELEREGALLASVDAVLLR
jgi:hypothetical protein